MRQSRKSGFLYPALLGLGLVLLVAVGVTSFRTTEIPQAPLELDKLTGEYDKADIQASWHGEVLATIPSLESQRRQVLGDNNALKRIEVDLTNQRLYAFEGNNKIYDFLISSGKWGKTPTGVFRIWGKFRYTKMSGGNKDWHTYYYLPNVPYVMYFGNDQIAASRGFGLHGTYWHSNFGHPMSHGCVNMKTEEAEKIFYWSTPQTGNKSSVRASDEDQGTIIVIYGTAPRE